jgi:hypothetical protein
MEPGIVQHKELSSYKKLNMNKSVNLFTRFVLSSQERVLRALWFFRTGFKIKSREVKTRRSSQSTSKNPCFSLGSCSLGSSFWWTRIAQPSEAAITLKSQFRYRKWTWAFADDFDVYLSRFEVKVTHCKRSWAQRTPNFEVTSWRNHGRLPWVVTITSSLLILITTTTHFC